MQIDAVIPGAGVPTDLSGSAGHGELQPQPMTLIEEPEAHLHPQAQLDLAELLESLTGQAIVSTHSAHLVTVVDPNSIRLLRDMPEGLRIVDFHPTTRRLDQSGEALFVEFDVDLCRKAYDAVGLTTPTPAERSDLMKAMADKKGSLGRLLAMELMARCGDADRAINDPGYWPGPLQELLVKLQARLG